MDLGLLCGKLRQPKIGSHPKRHCSSSPSGNGALVRKRPFGPGWRWLCWVSSSYTFRHFYSEVSPTRCYHVDTVNMYEAPTTWQVQSCLTPLLQLALYCCTHFQSGEGKRPRSFTSYDSPLHCNYALYVAKYRQRSRKSWKQQHVIPLFIPLSLQKMLLWTRLCHKYLQDTFAGTWKLWKHYHRILWSQGLKTWSKARNLSMAHPRSTDHNQFSFHNFSDWSASGNKLDPWSSFGFIWGILCIT